MTGTGNLRILSLSDTRLTFKTPDTIFKKNLICLSGEEGGLKKEIKFDWWH